MASYYYSIRDQIVIRYHASDLREGGVQKRVPFFLRLLPCEWLAALMAASLPRRYRVAEELVLRHAVAEGTRGAERRGEGRWASMP